MNKVYVQLLNEGTVVFRPVAATKVTENTYVLAGQDIYDPIDETWEFLPGEVVVVEMRSFDNGIFVLVAISAVARSN